MEQWTGSKLGNAVHCQPACLTYMQSTSWEMPGCMNHNRMGKTRDLFKKIRDIKGTFHAKMGSIKHRNGMDVTEAKDIKMRWQEYTEEVYKRS